jgi:hypothetical protein
VSPPARGCFLAERSGDLAHLIAQSVQRTFEQPRSLHLRDAQPRSDLGLGLRAEKTLFVSSQFGNSAGFAGPRVAEIGVGHIPFRPGPLRNYRNL